MNTDSVAHISENILCFDQSSISLSPQLFAQVTLKMAPEDHTTYPTAKSCQLPSSACLKTLTVTSDAGLPLTASSTFTIRGHLESTEPWETLGKGGEVV